MFVVCCLYAVCSVVSWFCGVACFIVFVTVQRYAWLMVCILNACCVVVVLCGCPDVRGLLFVKCV